MTSLFEPTQAGDIALPVTVTMVERAGSEAHLQANLGRQTLTVKTDPDRAATLSVGQPLTLVRHADADHGYYFISTFMEAHLRHHATQLA